MGHVSQADSRAGEKVLHRADEVGHVAEADSRAGRQAAEVGHVAASDSLELERGQRAAED